MMIDPQNYINNLKNKNYTYLIKEKNKLVTQIYEFENHKNLINEVCIEPSPDVIYKYQLLYLSELCKLIYAKYSSEDLEDDKTKKF